MSARYVAIILDGNGRWAQARGLPAVEGHRRGAHTLRDTLRSAVRHDIVELTVFTFSTENWNRPQEEVDGVMVMFEELIESETPELDQEGVRIRFIGRRDRIPTALAQRMDWSERATEGNSRLKLFVAFDYGGRAEILDAAQRFTGGGEEEFARLLYAPEMADPDLLIRTSGEQRLSNFLLWQCAYSELVFSDVLWPDFGEDHLVEALREFEERRRRFGTRPPCEQ